MRQQLALGSRDHSLAGYKSSVRSGMDVARIPEEYKVLRFLNSTPVRVSKSSLERMWASLFSVSVFVFAILAYLGASLEGTVCL